MTKEALHIFEILKNHPNGINRDEVNTLLEEGGFKPVTRKRFAKNLDALRRELRIVIDADRVKGLEFKYTLVETDNSGVGMATVLVTNLVENTFLEEYHSLGNRIQPVVIPRGHEYLRAIGNAMKRNVLMRCVYQKFSDTQPYECILAPYVLKAFEGRWYIFALKWNTMDEVDEYPLGTRGVGLQSFALDRMQSMVLTKVKFKLYKGFNAVKYFKPFFGVYCDMEPKPVKIVIRAGEDDAHYIRTLPLHYTQKETEPGVFTLEMCVTKDFEIYMRRYPDTTWEVEDN